MTWTRALFALFLITFAVAVTWPGMIPFNRIEPLVLGLPFSMFWVGMWVILGLIGGSAVAAFFFLNPELKPLDLHEGILGLLAHIPVLVGVSLITTRQSRFEMDRFFGIPDSVHAGVQEEAGIHG